MARRAAISGIAVFGSRLLGLVREQVFAFFFGASREYDAFLTAFRIPNLLRDLLAEGALSTAFVTVFSRELAQNGKARAFAVANGVLWALAWLLVLLVAAGMVFAPSLVRVMAMGFDPDKIALTAELTRLMFPFILFVALAALCMGMLNALGFYALPQSASSFFNITSILVGIGAAFFMAPEYMWGLLAGGHKPPGPPQLLAATAAPSLLNSAAARAMVGMSIGTLSGGLVQWLVQLPLLWQQGWRPKGRAKKNDPALREVLRLVLPAIVGAGAVQLSVFVNSNFASSLGDKPISWLAYSFRLMQFPIGIFGVAVMSASLPILSRQAPDADQRPFGQTLTQALELVLFLTTPAMVALAVLGTPVVRLLFEHGRFTPDDTRACAAALAAYAIGLPGYSALKIVQPAFIARGDAKTPMFVTICGVFCSIGLNAIFIFVLHWGHVGLALSTSVMATGSTVTLLLIMERRRPTVLRRRLAQQAGRILAAACAMGGTLLLATRALHATGIGSTAKTALLELALLGPLALLLYAALGRLFGVATMGRAGDMLLAKLRRRR